MTACLAVAQLGFQLPDAHQLADRLCLSGKGNVQMIGIFVGDQRGYAGFFHAQYFGLGCCIGDRDNGCRGIALLEI